MMVPPSATLGVAVSVTVVASLSSVTLVTAAVVSIVSASRPPPLVVAIVRETVPASMYGSSPGAAIDTVPVVAPAAMLIVWPLDNVTVSGVTAALVSVAV